LCALQYTSCQRTCSPLFEVDERLPSPACSPLFEVDERLPSPAYVGSHGALYWRGCPMVAQTQCCRVRHIAKGETDACGWWHAQSWPQSAISHSVEVLPDCGLQARCRAWTSRRDTAQQILNNPTRISKLVDARPCNFRRKHRGRVNAQSASVQLSNFGDLEVPVFVKGNNSKEQLWFFSLHLKFRVKRKALPLPSPQQPRTTRQAPLVANKVVRGVCR